LLGVLEMTPRNLDSHLKPLEKAGDVKLKKVLSDRSRTAVEITQKGAQETGKYFRLLRELLNGV